MEKFKRTEQFQYLFHTHVMFLLRGCSYQYSFFKATLYLMQ